MLMLAPLSAGNHELRDDLALLKVTNVGRDVDRKVNLVVFEEVLVRRDGQHDVGLRELRGRRQVVGQAFELLIGVRRNRVGFQAEPRIVRVDVLHREKIVIANRRETLVTPMRIGG